MLVQPCHKLLTVLTPLLSSMVLRRHTLNHDRIVHEGCVGEAIPSAFLQVVCMVEHGVNINVLLIFGHSRQTSPWLGFYNKTTMQGIDMIPALNKS